MARKASSKPESINSAAAIGIGADIGNEDADTFRSVEQPDLRADYVLASGSMSSNQSGDCPARSAMKTPKAKPQSLPRQRDIRRALIETDLLDCMVALPGQFFKARRSPSTFGSSRKTKTPTPNAASATAATRSSSSTLANSAP